MKELKFIVTGRSLSKSKLLAKVRNFEIIVDEPLEIGGSDEGPNPMEYLLIALAGCLNVTFQWIAAERGVDIHSLELILEGKLNPEKFNGILTKDRAGYKEITAILKVKSDASKKVLEDILRETKKRCPVSDNLMEPTPLRIEIENLQ